MLERMSEPTMVQLPVSADTQRIKDAEHLKLLSIFHYVVAGMIALFASFPIIHFIIGAAMLFGSAAARSKSAEPMLVGGFFMVFASVWILIGWAFAIAVVVAGRSISSRRRYVYCIIVAGLMAAACMPFGTVLGVFTIIVLVRPTVKEAFGQTP
jgi:hypothetical protein